MLNGTSYFGQGAIQEIVNEIKNRHFKKVLVTSTPDLFEFKVATKVTDLLDAAGIAYDVYDNIKPNPTIENVTSGVAACKAAGAEAVLCIHYIIIVIFRFLINRNRESKDLNGLDISPSYKQKQIA